MIFTLSDEHMAVKEAAREFAQKELLPGVIERDTKMIFPKEFVQKMGEMGFLGMMVSPEYGGSGLDTISYVLAMEEISKVDNSCSVIMSVNNSLVCWGLEEYGTEEQKRKYLPRLASGEIIGSFCLSEPEAGSDATSQRTTAVDMGDHYLLNGIKNWITSGGSSKIHLVIAQTDVEKNTEGSTHSSLRQIGKELRSVQKRTNSASGHQIHTPSCTTMSKYLRKIGSEKMGLVSNLP